MTDSNITEMCDDVTITDSESEGQAEQEGDVDDDVAGMELDDYTVVDDDEQEIGPEASASRANSEESFAPQPSSRNCGELLELVRRLIAEEGNPTGCAFETICHLVRGETNIHAGDIRKVIRKVLKAGLKQNVIVHVVDNLYAVANQEFSCLHKKVQSHMEKKKGKDCCLDTSTTTIYDSDEYRDSPQECQFANTIATKKEPEQCSDCPEKMERCSDCPDAEEQRPTGRCRIPDVVKKCARRAMKRTNNVSYDVGPTPDEMDCCNNKLSSKGREVARSVCLGVNKRPKQHSCRYGMERRRDRRIQEMKYSRCPRLDLHPPKKPRTENQCANNACPQFADDEEASSSSVPPCFVKKPKKKKKRRGCKRKKIRFKGFNDDWEPKNLSRRTGRNIKRDNKKIFCLW